MPPDMTQPCVSAWWRWGARGDPDTSPNRPESRSQPPPVPQPWPEMPSPRQAHQGSGGICHLVLRLNPGWELEEHRLAGPPPTTTSGTNPETDGGSVEPPDLELASLNKVTTH
ncbi:Hypothetical predicted protein [Pelobates cultripes]|uniref:Uncharacterized protein n=1 Tax=Pelobates cultripes TaxID=61616 RepID=A0AAD1RIR1_PELCU|nr:Hypothetical predicted protein [Pelobates cultripes]